jgi:DNA-binding NtrC family response regulator
VSRALDWFKHLTADKRSANAVEPRTRSQASQSGKTTVLGVGLAVSERLAVEEVATSSGWHLTLAETCDHAVQLLADRECAAVLCDRDLSGTDWRTAIKRLTRIAPNSCVVLVSAVNDEYLWQEVVQSGGFDVITKPFQPDHVRRHVDHAWLFWKTGIAQQDGTLR